LPVQRTARILPFSTQTRTPFAYTPTLTDEAVAVSQEVGVCILLEAGQPRHGRSLVFGGDPHAQAGTWKAFQDLRDNPRGPVDLQPGRLARLGAGLRRFFAAGPR
jgi:hypothetical protein